MLSAPLHLQHQIGGARCGGHGQRGPDVDRRFRCERQQVECVRDPHHFVQRTAVDGVPAEPRLLKHVRGLGREHALRERHDGRARRHQLAHGAIRKRQHAGDDRHLIGISQRRRIGARQQRGQRGACRRLTPRNKGREHRPEPLHPGDRARDQRFRPAPAQHTRHEIRRTDEERDAHGNREHTEERRSRGGEERRDRAGSEQHAERRECVGRRQGASGILQQSGGRRRPAQLVRNPARELMLAHRCGGDADGGRDAGDEEAEEQNDEGDAHCFSNET